MIKYKKEKSKPELIWLDTNVVLEMAYTFTGKKPNHTNKDRAVSLYKLFQDKVNSGEILCPFLNQRDEYINKDVYEVCDSILMSLSKGKQLKTYITANTQIKKMMGIYLNKGNVFELSRSDTPFYHEDKKDYLEKKRKSEEKYGLSVTVLLSGQNKEGNDKETRFLFDFFQQRKDFIQKEKMSYEQVYNEELLSKKLELKQSIEKVKSLYGEMKIDFTESNDFYYTLYPLIAWHELTQSLNIEELDKFFDSDYFAFTPNEDISSALVAKKLTDSSNVQFNDIRDIRSISIILPYASMIIVDRAMKNNITQLGLDKKYETKVFCLKDETEITDYIKKI